MLSDMRIPSLNAIRSFVVTARHMSITKAAEELHVTTGAVSRMVRLLEEDLGMPLFKRVGSVLELTPAGVAYYAQVSDLFDRIATATLAARVSQKSNVLALASFPSFNLHWLIPRLPKFKAEHPDILIDLLTLDVTKMLSQNGLIDFSSNRFQAVISLCRNEAWKGINKTLLIQEQFSVYCAPQFLKRSASVRAPKDLLSFPLLLDSLMPDLWDEYFRFFGVNSETKRVIARYEHAFMLSEAAFSSEGFALLSKAFMAQATADGRLIQAIPHTLQTGRSYCFLHPSESESSKKLRLFKQWILKESDATKACC